MSPIIFPGWKASFLQRADKGITKRFCFMAKSHDRGPISLRHLIIITIFLHKIQQVKTRLMESHSHLLNNHSGFAHILIFNSSAVLSNLQLVSLVPSTVPLTEYILTKHTFLNEAQDTEVTSLMGRLYGFNQVGFIFFLFHLPPPP